MGMDLVTGEGVAEALEGVDAVIDASGSGARSGAEWNSLHDCPHHTIS